MPVTMPTDLRLLEFDQRPVEVLGMQEEDGLVMRAYSGLAGPEDPRPRPDQMVARRENVVDFVAEMVDAAGRAALQESGDRGRVAERFEQLDLGIRQLDEDDGYAVRRQRDRRSRAGSGMASGRGRGCQSG